MKIKILLSVLVLIALNPSNSFAQFNPYADDAKMITAGFGFSGWGIPIFARYEHPVADNITVGGAFSYQSDSESYVYGKWKHTIIGFNGRGSYHFNELLNVDDVWDFYAGPTIGFYSWKTKIDGSEAYDYGGAGSGGFNIAIHIGGRYFINDKIAINVEADGGSVLGGGTIGVTFIL